MWVLLLFVVMIGCDRSSNSPVAPDENASTPTSLEETGKEPLSEENASSPSEEPEPSPAEEGFTLELIFLPNHRLNDAQVALVRKAAKRWESVIVGDIPDEEFASVPFDTERDFEWGTARTGSVVIDYVVDDVAVLITTDPGITGGAWGGVHMWRASNGLPLISYVILAENLLEESETVLEMVLLHELGHCLGFGTVWPEDLLIDPSRENSEADTYFSGPLAVEAFNAAGGESYEGNKVPVANGGDDGHWRGSVFGNELMASNVDATYPYFLSAITIQSLADLGYKVDPSQADPFTLP